MALRYQAVQPMFQLESGRDVDGLFKMHRQHRLTEVEKIM